MNETANEIGAGNLPEYSVSELSGAIRRAVEEGFPFVRVRGEISGLKFATSGHTYFDLKDDKAVLNAIIWKQSARVLRLKPEQGMEVVCTGRITTYPGSSRYQLIVEQIELAGLGALMALLEERKKRLEKEGLFHASRKKALPFLPDVIGVVTSPTGAVLRDIMHRLDARFPRRVLLWPVAVQGERAATEVAAAIAGFNALDGKGLPRPDLLIVARGGGSLEDLMAFNEEAVVRAAAASTIPLISAVGHETDTTLIDFAADVRAPTPTAAAELAVPVRTELLAATLELERRSLRSFSRGMEDRRRHLFQLLRILPRAEQLFGQPRQRFDVASERLNGALRRNLQVHRAELSEVSAIFRDQLVVSRFGLYRDRIAVLEARATRAQRVRVATATQVLVALGRMLDGISYRSVLARGFALVRGEGTVLRRRAGTVVAGERLTLIFADGEVQAVAGGSKAPAHPRKPPGDQGSLF
jgi:exodeoxyribonuclease VII large subunit